jgi:hypothetical protein
VDAPPPREEARVRGRGRNQRPDKDHRRTPAFHLSAGARQSRRRARRQARQNPCSRRWGPDDYGPISARYSLGDYLLMIYSMAQRPLFEPRVRFHFYFKICLTPLVKANRESSSSFRSIDDRPLLRFSRALLRLADRLISLARSEFPFLPIHRAFDPFSTMLLLGKSAQSLNKECASSTSRTMALDCGLQARLGQ